MIVKNESKIIRRCLDSVKRIIDTWVIVDTGSTDGTQEEILSTLKSIPGKLHSRPWVDFSHNRNEALELAKPHADYILFLDADEQFIYAPSFILPPLTFDCYTIEVHQDGNRYHRISLIDSSLDWSWIGVLHESIYSPTPKTKALLPHVINLSTTQDGHRFQDPDKYLKDAAILKKALETDPHNSRYVFYLAISYGNAHKHALAIQTHAQRATMGGCEEEVFMSLYIIGGLQDLLNYPSQTVIQSYTKAYLFRPTRAEPLFWLAKHYEKQGNYLMGYLIAEFALKIPLPQDNLWVQYGIYHSDLPKLFADCARKLKLGNLALKL